jgi:hypothetical protein
MNRTFIVLLLLLLLSACSRGGDNGAAAISSQASPYQMLNSSADLSVGTSRLVLTLWDGETRLSDAQALDVSLYRLNEAGEASEQIWEGAATAYDMAGAQYWVAYPDFPAAEIYGVRAIVTNAEGQRVENVAVVQVQEDAQAPTVGEEVPLSETRTLDDAPIEELTSAPPYVERFYELSVAEAVQSGKPSVIVFATPGHCTSSLCAPVMDSVQTVSDEVGDSINVVHVEVWRDFAAQVAEPAFREWNLPSEPSVFVLDEEGKVAARLDSLIGVDELRQAVQEVTGG